VGAGMPELHSGEDTFSLTDLLLGGLKFQSTASTKRDLSYLNTASTTMSAFELWMR